MNILEIIDKACILTNNNFPANYQRENNQCTKDQTIMALTHYLNDNNVEFFSGKENRLALPLNSHYLILSELIKNIIKIAAVNFNNNITNKYNSHDITIFQALLNKDVSTEKTTSLMELLLLSGNVESVDYFLNNFPYLTNRLIESFVETRYRSNGIININNLENTYNNYPLYMKTISDIDNHYIQKSNKKTS